MEITFISRHLCKLVVRHTTRVTIKLASQILILVKNLKVELNSN